ncbi:saccharopine dehydrogenase family protein [bacterium]|nr:saccharopine dehydrogenase family protein [bacterium]
MGTVLIIGAGGVGSVVTHKCAQAPAVFPNVWLASRTIAKCEAIRASVRAKTRRAINIARVDADNVPELVRLIRRVKPRVVINVALPYQDLTIMDACLATGVDYLDTANYEPPDEAKFCYKWQWAYRRRFKDAGLTALLGCGFDPGVTNIFTAYARKHHFDAISHLDIVDANAGSHGHAFATNFNPEINIREITQRGKYYENGRWVVVPPLSRHCTFDFPGGIGPKEIYLLYHEELESLAKNIKGARRMRFWMTFSENYLTHLRVLQNVGMTRIDPVVFQGREIVPIQFLKALLPDPASLAKNYTGKTCIGCVIHGTKKGKARNCFIYNICDHAQCYKEVNAQAISYTTGVPAMIGAMLMAKGVWKQPGVFNTEEFDPDPFMAALNTHGLPWKETFPRKGFEGFVEQRS